jgi:zinc D-Ala-D-Ala dipeptidase
MGNANPGTTRKSLAGGCWQPHSPPMILQEITEALLPVQLDLRYATSNNLTGKPVYKLARCFLHPQAATCLGRAAEQAIRLGLRLKILDAYRPPEAQWVFWRHSPDPEFVADPKVGSAHGRGAAVDLTLVDSNGAELDMGTGFDAFTPQSWHGDGQIPAAAQRNRLLLLGLMTGAGWEHYPKEWWHYQLPGAAARLPLLADGAAAPSLM